MRLLKLGHDGELSLVTFVGNEIPLYAILSHTWGTDSDEVTFEDITRGTGKDKAGYKKIQFCVKQAALDGLIYSWVDTCCINKANMTELTTAINSMFRWYSNATKCYVYLSDVSCENDQVRKRLWEPAFRESRWFTRGWTLQELVASKSLQFYSANGTKIGDKKSLERAIHEITSISTEALSGKRHLQDFSVDERMLWAEKRETTLEEDQIYCLLGIFGVHMFPIYGEGKDYALFWLLEEINRRSKKLQYENSTKVPQSSSSVPIRDGRDTLEDLISKGAIYIGFNGLNLDKELSRYKNSNAYVLSFSKKFLGNDLWESNLKLFQQLLNECKSSTLYAVLDCDAISVATDSPQISHFHMGQEITKDFLEQQKFFARRCFARCFENALEIDNVNKPAKRRFVEIPCPGENCSPDRNHLWTCSRCLAALEFGYTDDFIYCNCGRSLYTKYNFKCNSKTHNSQFVQHSRARLYSLLNNLSSSRYLNVLILGETGVGKSTFINALVNYFEFDTLDDALCQEHLNWVVPFSFSTQMMDGSNPDRGIEERSIRITNRADEDGNEIDSATKQTTVYSITISSAASIYTIRFIDTPGIGDTRGVECDQKNMSDILSVLSSYDDIHGILILVKPNHARLSITFQYCVEQILTHLHHSASQNIVFGFTNTRISNYTPGDTFGPLKQLLDRYPNTGLQLTARNTYCFDSESFRYLAATKSGVTIPEKDIFSRGWKQSRQEIIRLITYMWSMPPHRVKHTISWNQARELIMGLTMPMVDISQTIRVKVGFCQERIKGINMDHAGDIVRKQRALEHFRQRIAECEGEFKIVRVAAAKFSAFLNVNSIIPYNDATVEYLELLIKEEEAEVHSGVTASQQRLRDLIEDIAQHKETVKDLVAAVEMGDALDEDGIERIKDELYKLKHFGADLRKVQHGIAAVHEATYREITYTIRQSRNPSVAFPWEIS
jgi:predicted GTPase